MTILARGRMLGSAICVRLGKSVARMAYKVQFQFPRAKTDSALPIISQHIECDTPTPIPESQIIDHNFSV